MVNGAQRKITSQDSEESDKIGIRTLGIPEKFGGLSLDPQTEVRTFAIISEEVARGDSVY